MAELTHMHNGRTTTIELFTTPKAARRAVRNLREHVLAQARGASTEAPPVQLHAIVAINGGYAIDATVKTRSLFGVGSKGVALEHVS